MPAVTRTSRDQLITDNLPLVGYLASMTYQRGGALSRDELASAGALALVMAADSFDAALGVPFSAYARRRILGAFADEMRAMDWATRGIRKRVKATTAVRDTLTAHLGRQPTVDEMAVTLGVDAGSVTESLADAARTVTAFDDRAVQLTVAELPLPDEIVERGEHDELLNLAIDALPERMRLIIRAVYFDERTVKDLADELGVSHAAVSQQRAEAVRLLRDALARHYPGESTVPSVPASRLAATTRDAYFDRIATSGRRFASAFLPQATTA